MTDATTATAEYRSWEWELVLQYEDGSLAVDMWNEATLNMIASWYAKNLPSDQAIARYQQHYHRNHRRLTHRLDGASVAEGSIEAVHRVWDSLLIRALDARREV